MKINDILTEGVDEQFFEQIFNSEFFKTNHLEKFQEAKKSNTPFDELRMTWLYHGSGNIPDEPTIIETHSKRLPRDTSLYVHNMINKLSKEKFGVAIRNLIFSYNTAFLTRDYGHNRFILFPLGNYDLYYANGVMDMTIGYKFSVHGSDHYVMFMDYLSEKFNGFEKYLGHIKLMNPDLINEFNRVSDDKTMTTFVEHFFTSDEMDEKEKQALIKSVVNYHRKFVKEEVNRYLDRVESTNVLKKSHNEYMISADKIIAIPSEMIRELYDFIDKKL